MRNPICQARNAGFSNLTEYGTDTPQHTPGKMERAQRSAPIERARTHAGALLCWIDPRLHCTADLSGPDDS